MKDHLKIVKLLFVSIILALIGTTISSSIVVRAGHSLIVDKLVPSANLNYNKFLFAFATTNNVLASVGSAVSGPSAEEHSVAQGIASSIPVLLYHGIVSKPDSISMTQSTFRDQMFALKKAGYYTINLDDFYQFETGKKSFSGKPFLLTFDDGRRDSYVGATPILSAINFKAVMFIATADSLNGVNGTKSIDYYLHENDIKNMVAGGVWEIGSHAIQASTTGGLILTDEKGTLGNFLSNMRFLIDKQRLESAEEYTMRVKTELSESKSQLANLLGSPVVALAYPFGDYGDQTVNDPDAETLISQYMKSDYLMGFRQVWPYDGIPNLNYAGDDLYHLRRIETGTIWTGNQLVAYIEKSQVKELPYSDQFTANFGWKRNWGILSFDSGLELKSSASTTGAMSFLDGTYPWVDYAFSGFMSSSKESQISLIARFIDSSNYVSCTVTDSTVSIRQTVEGVTTTLTSTKNTIQKPGGQILLGISVEGSTVKCYEGSSIVALSHELSTSLNHGGIALQTWNKDINNADLTVSSISVTSISSFAEEVKTLPSYSTVTVSTSLTNTKPTTNAIPTVLPSKSSIIVAPTLLAGSFMNIPLPYVFNPSNNTAAAFDASLYTLNPDQPDIWKLIFGKQWLADGILNIAAATSSTGAAIYLPGGADWTDYAFNANINWIKASSVGMVARFKDSKNYVACQFVSRGTYAKIYEYRDGNSYPLDESILLTQNGHNLIWPSGLVGIQVQGNTVSCLRDGKIVVSDTISTLPQKGTIGVKVYAPVPGAASMDVRSIRVSTVTNGQ